MLNDGKSFVLQKREPTVNILGMKKNVLTQAIEIVGLRSLARICEVSPQALYGWQKRNRLPRTDWTGETDYASRIEKATGGQITRAQLLDLNRSAHDSVQQPPESV